MPRRLPLAAVALAVLLLPLTGCGPVGTPSGSTGAAASPSSAPTGKSAPAPEKAKSDPFYPG